MGREPRGDSTVFSSRQCFYMGQFSVLDPQEEVPESQEEAAASINADGGGEAMTITVQEKPRNVSK
jgi:hypothetical protein